MSRALLLPFAEDAVGARDEQKMEWVTGTICSAHVASDKTTNGIKYYELEAAVHYVEIGSRQFDNGILDVVCVWEGISQLEFSLEAPATSGGGHVPDSTSEWSSENTLGGAVS